MQNTPTRCGNDVPTILRDDICEKNNMCGCTIVPNRLCSLRFNKSAIGNMVILLMESFHGFYERVILTGYVAVRCMFFMRNPNPDSEHLI